jgi:hypothetical protein
VLDKRRRDDGEFDVLVPVLGGKDGSHMAYLKRVYLEGGYKKIVERARDIPASDLNFFRFLPWSG